MSVSLRPDVAGRDTVPSAHVRDLALLYGFALFGVLAIVIPFTAIQGIDFGHITTLVAYLLLVYSAARLGGIIAQGEARMLATAFWTFCYSFLLLPLLAQISTGTYPLATAYAYSTTTIAAAELTIAAGIIGFELGSISWRRHRVAKPSRQSEYRIGLSVFRAALLGYIGLAFVLFEVDRYGLASFFTSRDALTENFLGPAQAGGVKFYLNSSKAAGASLRAISQVPTFIGAYFLLYVRHEARRLNVARVPSWWLITPLLVGNVLINNPIANPRYWYVTVLIGFASIYLPIRKRRGAARIFVLLFVFVSLFSFHQLAAFRRTGTVDLASQPLNQSLVSDPDYASPQQVLNGIAYVRAAGHSDGRQLAGAVLVWVPRSIWHGKPTDTGTLVGGAAGFQVSAPLWTEGYVDFGILGAFGYLFVVGIFVSRLDRRMIHAVNPGLLTAFVPVAASLLVFILRGSLQPAFGDSLPVVACMLFCLTRRVATDGRAPSQSQSSGPAVRSRQHEPLRERIQHSPARRPASGARAVQAHAATGVPGIADDGQAPTEVR